MTTDNEKALQARVDALESRLFGAGKMAPRANAYDPTANMTLPASAVADMVAAVPQDAIDGARADASRARPKHLTTPSAEARRVPASEPVRRGTGWIDTPAAQRELARKLRDVGDDAA